jgi:hypothetical protein
VSRSKFRHQRVTLGSLRAFVVAQRRERVRRGLAPGLAQAVLYRGGVTNATPPLCMAQRGRERGMPAEKTKKRHQILATVKAC